MFWIFFRFPLYCGLMRLLVYNIRYGTGAGRRLPWAGYFKRTGRNLEEIAKFIASVDPDIAGLLEVDAGSFRSARRNQAEVIAGAIGHYHCCASKYGRSSFTGSIPVLNKQANAFLTSERIYDYKCHFLRNGMKRLVMELEMRDFVVFLVHLSLTFRARHFQLADLHELVRASRKPAIVAGDFNAFWGDREIRMFLSATGMRSAAPAGCATFPSWAPRRQLDFILHDPAIQVERCLAPRVEFSDHLPLVCDFQVAQRLKEKAAS